MKKQFVIPFSLLLFACVCSCKKNNIVTGPSNFSWTIGTTTTTANWDSAFVRSRGTNPLIMAGKSNNSMANPSLVISISSFNNALYSIGNGNEIEYHDDNGNIYFSISGTVNITAYNNNRLSGIFSVSLAGPAGSFPVNGQFTNVPVAP